MTTPGTPSIHATMYLMVSPLDSSAKHLKDRFCRTGSASHVQVTGGGVGFSSARKGETNER